MRIRGGLAVWVFLVVWGSATGSLSAQAVAVAQVAGTVVDPSGSAVPGALVTMTETGKRIPRSTMTDPDGFYVLPNLPVGPYSLDIKANGFKNYVQSGIVLV